MEITVGTTYRTRGGDLQKVAAHRGDEWQAPWLLEDGTVVTAAGYVHGPHEPNEGDLVDVA